MARKTNTRPNANAWQWSRTAETRRGMLRAAREVFTERGFADASVADVVERAGSSVGSLYHHFGGKAELFLALWEDHQAAQEEAASAAVAALREAGEDDPLELFIAGAQAFLDDSWQRRDLVRLLMDGDGPPGFELMRRTRNREWVRQNAVLLGAGSDPDVGAELVEGQTRLGTEMPHPLPQSREIVHEMHPIGNFARSFRTVWCSGTRILSHG